MAVKHASPTTDVNLAARLMQAAAPNEILVSGRAQSKLADMFAFNTKRLLKVKGKRGEIPVFTALEENRRRGIRIQEPAYYLPMAGRQAELQLIHEKLDLTLQGKSQAIGITAEAGLGKSRLAAEAIRAAQRKGFLGYGGACQSDGINTPYLAWKSIWQAFFDLDPDMPLEKQIEHLAGKIAQHAPNRVNAMPLLNVVLDLRIPENDFTHNLEPKVRQSALHALLEDCLKSAAKESPLLIVLEDLHWIDVLSRNLLYELAKALTKYRGCFLLAYRPTELAQVESLPQFAKIELRELSNTEAEQILNAKLMQFFGESVSIPQTFAEKLLERAQGNPFYLEELLNYLHDRGLDPRNLGTLENIDLPDSLHSLILSRIDRLLEREKITLKVASIIGRLFKADWLRGYYPDLGDAVQVKNNLSELAQLEITPLDTPEPELAYLFKHIITHEVTYESLPYATRAKLHEQLAQYLEQTYPNALPLEALAFHYEHSNNTAKKIEYLRKAGEAAQQNFANNAALEYYEKLLSLLADEMEKFEVYLKRGQIFELMGQLDKAENDYRAALEFARDDLTQQADAQFALGKLNRQKGEFESALAWQAQTKNIHATLNNTVGLAQVLTETGIIWFRKGEYAQASEILNEGLALAREANDALITALALHNLGTVCFEQSNYGTAKELFEESLSLGRETGNKAHIAISFKSLGNLALVQSDYVGARPILEESLALNRETGDKAGVAALLNNLGLMAKFQGDYDTARTLLEESLALEREMGAKAGIAISLGNLGDVVSRLGDYATAQALLEESLALDREVGNKMGIAASLGDLGIVAFLQGNYDSARTLSEESLKMCQDVQQSTIKASALLILGLVGLAENDPQAGAYILDSLRAYAGAKHKEIFSLIGVAGLALQNGNPQFAAQLLGAIDEALKVFDGVVTFELKYFHPQTLAKTKEALGEAAFQSAWEVGSAWSLEEAVAKALEENT